MGSDKKAGSLLLRGKSIRATDRAIIRWLQIDGRKSYASIASELDLSPSTVQQRANRLINAGLITVKGMVHPADLDESLMAMVAINADGTRVKEVADQIAGLPEVRWVVVCAGLYDILAEVVCKDGQSLLSLLSDKLATIDGVNDTITFIYLEVAKRTHEWLLPE